MTSPLHKSPVGLLEILALKTVGRAPEFFADTMIPHVDAIEFYAARNKLVSGAAATVGGITGAGIQCIHTLSGPVRVSVVGGVFAAGAAAVTNATISIDVGIGAGTVGLSSIFYPAINAGATITFGIVVPGWVFLPQTVFSARVSGTGAGVDHSIQLMLLIDNITSTAA